MNFAPAGLVPGAGGAEGETIGVRPEAVALAPAGGGTLAATVEQVEALGHETLVHVRLAGGDAGEAPRWVVREHGMAVHAPGERVALRVDANALHRFGRDGRAIIAP